MSTSKQDISEWFDRGVKQKATHMLVVCDSFDHEDYPVYVKASESVREKYNEYEQGKHSMQSVMEVYCLGKNKAKQLAQLRSFNFN